MTAQEIIDRLKAEIKQQIKREEYNFAALGGGGQTWNIGTLEWVLKCLSDLEEECEETPKEIEEVARMIYPNKEGDLCSLHSTLQRGGYIRGYQDCKEQMMKEAVEGVVSLQFADGTGAVRTTDGFVLNGLRCGQKVRIIIVKED